MCATVPWVLVAPSAIEQGIIARAGGWHVSGQMRYACAVSIIRINSLFFINVKWVKQIGIEERSSERGRERERERLKFRKQKSSPHRPIRKLFMQMRNIKWHMNQHSDWHKWIKRFLTYRYSTITAWWELILNFFFSIFNNFNYKLRSMRTILITCFISISPFKSTKWNIV